MADQIGVIFKELTKVGSTATNQDKAMTSLFQSSNEEKDKLLPLDGYNRTVQDTLTNLKNAISEKLAMLKDFLSVNSLTDWGFIGDALKMVTDITSTALNLRKQLEDFVGGGINFVLDVTEGVLDFGNEILNTVNDNPFVSALTNGSLEEFIYGADTNFMNSVIGNFNNIFADAENRFDKIKDKASETALYAMLLKDAIGAGISGLVGKIAENTQDNEDIRRVLIEEWETAVKRGELNMLNTVLEAVGVEAIMQKYPDSVNNILNSFYLPWSYKTTNFEVYGEALESLLFKLDPKWDIIEKSGRVYTNLYNFSDVSYDAKRCLIKLNEKYIRPLMVAQHFKVESLRALALTQYPYVAIR